MRIYTIGHSTHNQDEFVSLLKEYNIEILVDVRSYPGSRYCPQFNKENMRIWLNNNNIQYVHMPELGGRRRKLYNIDESLIDGWTHISFRNYAAYTLTDEYEKGIGKLIEIANNHNISYMCSESIPWKCHRSIISNTLTMMGIEVYHIMCKDKFVKHELGKYGAIPRLNGNKIIYPKIS